ncbi:MAG: acyl-CoA dehydrogenase C-terminal domain-containing protein [Oceanospirillaceae bacterium]
MPNYQAPIRDMQFVLYELHNASKLVELTGFEQASQDLVIPVLNAAASFNEQVLFPLNRSGDEQGCLLEQGKVSTPTGFKQAYQQLCEGGWTAFNCDTQYGGMNMPKSVHSMVEEMLCSANLSFGIYPGLTYGVYQALHSFASSALKDKFLPKLVDGKWSGTMCLTEAHCGTDLGLCRTQAKPQKNGSYLISGTKIFISAGQHDLTDNIIHLVLARRPDAVAGIKGISLFVVPRNHIDENGESGANNNVICSSIENKMGIKASATCTINFEDAQGWLVGDLNKGMRGMFSMMNRARLAVSIQGIGLCEISYQGAVEYAKTRLQGRSLTGAKHPDKIADPIIVHPDVRRMLMTMRAYTQGCRAFGAWVSQEYDNSIAHKDAKRRKAADEFVQLTTPIVKSLFTDVAFECTNLGVQVFGGHGFIHESAMEQYVRDCRITQIYEGTNGIQALDLIGRKLPEKAGRNLRHFFHPIQEYIEKNAANTQLIPFIQPLTKAFERLQQATGHIVLVGLSKPEQAAAVASEYLKLFGLVALAFMWCKMAQIAQQNLTQDTEGFYTAKVTTSLFFMQKILPQTSALFAAIMTDSKTIMALDEEQF